MAEVNELITRFVFEGNLSPLSDFNDSLEISIKGLGVFVTAAAGAAAASLAWGKSILGPVDAMANLAIETGVAIEKQQEWNYIAASNNSSAEAVTNSITGLTSAIAEASISGSEDFARLGISIRGANGELKTADQVLTEVQRRFAQSDFTITQKQNLAETLGIDASLIQSLTLTTEQMESLKNEAREFGIITKEQGEATIASITATAQAGVAFESMQRQIAVGLAPELLRLSNAFKGWVAENQDWIKNVASGLAKSVLAIGGALSRLSPVLSIIAAGFAASKIAALGFSGVMGLLLSPVVLITAGVTAAILAIDDLIVAFQGGNSVIADFAQSFFDIDIGEAMRNMVDDAKLALSMIDDLFAPIGEFFGFGSTPGQAASAPAMPTGGGTVNQDVNINISATNAEQAREGVRRGLQENLISAQDQFRRGGR